MTATHGADVQQRIAEAIAEIRAQRLLPCATYRLQFGAGFGFEDARRLVPYLAQLGVSHVYASPLQRSRPGSHGYDIVDHSVLDPALGSREDFEAFTAALRDHGMGLILDVVPNHMGVGGADNRWWLDVLEYGRASAYAHYFDIDWDPPTSDTVNKVLLPILEDQYGIVLEAGKFALSFEDGAFRVRYYDHILPVAPSTYSRLLRLAFELRPAAADGDGLRELAEIAAAADRIGVPDAHSSRDALIACRAAGEELKRRLRDLAASSAAVREAIAAAVARYNGGPGDPRSFDALDALLSAQSYRPAYWRVASEEINYRRFFDINELAAIRVEHEDVFADTHRLVFDLLVEGHVQGLRVDHPDGLRDPGVYFERLQKTYLAQSVARRLAIPLDEAAAGVEDWWAAIARRDDGPDPPLYVVAEKILSEGEQLPVDWQVHGTTGYDFLNDLNGVFVDPRTRRAFDRIYDQFGAPRASFAEIENVAKKMIMLVSFAGEVNTLGHLLDRVAADNRRYRDFTRNALIFAIREIIAALPVYRTYIIPPDVSARDRAYIEAAMRSARRRNPRTARSLFDFVGETLLLDNAPSFSEHDLPRLYDFVLRFQQITGPVMAKGVEDTAFYVYHRLVSLNEVGGRPGRFGSSVQALHLGNEHRRRTWPHTLLASSTHDTKRSEDVRARINLLSEMPAEWRSAVMRWRDMNASWLGMLDGEETPDPNDQCLLYQTLVGAWPLRDDDRTGFAERIAAYMEKATKEAKVHTSWVNPNAGYDEATRRFVEGILADDAFVADIDAFARKVAFFGRLNSLSQLVLKLASPGVPDVYQGADAWDLSLVDPDNRRVPDYEVRRRLMDALCSTERDAAAICQRIMDDADPGLVKMFVLRAGLGVRRDWPELFTTGEYQPLDSRGPAQRHVIAFARGHAGGAAIAVAPRLVYGLLSGEARPPIGDPVWGDTVLRLPPPYGARVYRNVFTGETVVPEGSARMRTLRLADALRRFPVALLIAE